MDDEYFCIVSPRRIIHKIADCCDCEFYMDSLIDKNMTGKIKRHVEKTGHEVVYETGHSMRYRAL